MISIYSLSVAAHSALTGAAAYPRFLEANVRGVGGEGGGGHTPEASR